MEVVVMEEMEVHSSVPIQLTTSRTTLVLVCFSMQTAELWGTDSRLWPSTASSLSPHLSLPSLLAGLSGTTNNTWTGSGLRSVPGSAPPTIEKPQLVPSFLWRMTVLGYCNCRGSFCQNIQLGIKFEAPKLVSGPSMMVRLTVQRLMVAFSVATAWE